MLLFSSEGKEQRKEKARRKDAIVTTEQQQKADPQPRGVDSLALLLYVPRTDRT